MKKIVLSLIFLAFALSSSAMSEKERRDYLKWMQESLLDVPQWTEWQKQTGELPPDFDKLPKSNLLPNPLLFFDGTPVNKTPESWAKRRKEILSLFEKYVTGTFPPKPSIDRVVMLDSTNGEGYKVLNVRAEFGPQSKGSVRIRLVIPDVKKGEKLPVLISPNLAGWSSSLVRRGYISAGYAGGDFMDDALPLKELYPDYDFATLPRRAWLAQIVVDYLEKTPEADMKKIAIFGYSRDGKMATIAAALDERIAALVAGSTGVGGVVPWRLAGERGGGEGIETTTRMFPEWFSYRLRFFSGREDRLPVDANLLLALVAPRAALFEWGFTDQVANGWGMEQAYLSAKDVYNHLGKPCKMAMMPIAGFHGSNDQEACIDWLDMQFGRSPKVWREELKFPWDFDEWVASSKEKIDISKFPIHKSTTENQLKNNPDRIKSSIEWMLGDKPPMMVQSDDPLSMMMRRRPNPGPTVVAQGNVGNPGQLAPDVPAWVIASGGSEYGWLEPEKNQVESRRIRFNGVTGDLYYPKDSPKGAKLPTVIWLHGYHYPLGYMWVYRRDLHPILALTKAGYAVLAYDQSGFGTRWSEAENFYNRYPNWSKMGKMVEDVISAVDVLEKDSIVNPNNISLYGYAMGGTVGLYAAALDQRISGVVSICGFTPMRTDTPDRGTSGMSRYSHLYGLMPRLGLFAGEETRLPYDFDDVMSMIAPRALLVVQPTMDRDANPQEVKIAVEKAAVVFGTKNAQNKIEIQEPDDYARLTDATQNKIIEWMEKTIKSNK